MPTRGYCTEYQFYTGQQWEKQRDTRGMRVQIPVTDL